MKLTEEQYRELSDQYESSEIPGIWEFLQKYEFPNPQPEPNTAQWIHCSERLPTKEDADGCEVATYSKLNGLQLEEPTDLCAGHNTWWTPAPKNLTPPPPKDPFEEWWKNNWLTTENPNARDLAKSAFEAGKQSK